MRDWDDSPRSLFDSSRPKRDSAAFIPVALDGFPAGSRAPCDLYWRNRAGRYVLFAGQGLLFDGFKCRQLNSAGLRNLYVRREEAAPYFNFLKETLVALVQDPHTPAAIKAKAVQNGCREVLRQILEEPRAVFLSQAEEIIAATVDLIISGGDAVRHLIDLTSYDHSTYVHSTNVGIFAVALARQIFGFSSVHDLKRLGAGFFLHDLGKRQIPIEILNKPGALTGDERQIVNLHPEDGHRLLLDSALLSKEVEVIILQHHERDDGGGYPHGLRAGDIHPYARICRLADVYEALTSQRPYHRQRSTFEALKLMREEVLVDLDRSLFEAFLGLFSR